MHNRVDSGASEALVASSGAAFRIAQLFPRYVDETQARMRGLTVAWYAVDNEGAIIAGPFPNRDECVARISQLPERSPNPDLWRRPDPARAQRAA